MRSILLDSFQKKIIITGTGRCGSAFFHKMLTNCGLDLGEHEKSHGVNGGILNFGWNSQIHDSGLIKNTEQYIQVGLIREPLACISSQSTGSKGQGPRMHLTEYFKTKVAAGKGPLHKGMLYYYYVNNFLYELYKNNKIDSIFKIEDCKDRDKLSDLLELFAKAGLRVSVDTFIERSKEFGTNYNTRKHKNYSWDDLHKKDTILTNKIQRLSQKLNYKIK